MVVVAVGGRSGIDRYMHAMIFYGREEGGREGGYYLPSEYTYFELNACTRLRGAQVCIVCVING